MSNVREGQGWTSSPKRLTLTQLNDFQPPPVGTDAPRSGNFHSDPELARQQGWPTAVAWALMPNAYVEELMLTAFGQFGLSNGAELNLAFTAPVYVDDQLTSHLRIRSVKNGPDGRDVVLDAWCENQHGNRVAIGDARVRLPVDAVR